MELLARWLASNDTSQWVVKLWSIITPIVAVLPVRAVVLIVCKTEVAIRAHIVEAIASNFSIHVSDFTPAVLDRVNFRPNAETHLTHEEKHECLGHQIYENLTDNEPRVRDIGEKKASQYK